MKNKSNDWWLGFGIISVMIAIILAIVLGVCYADYQNTVQMKACVKSGQQWKIDNHGDNICVR